ncbi:hypothetical protein [Psychromicrobium xiongbiense]|uniref:hypothetical protein n=1 Tax=Psychromicrobium xiongbiense TaxID=3051184 RepID=UPI002554AC05|nr:hypothetical protein [Psychromicrobium sp. YIM S02556]
MSEMLGANPDNLRMIAQAMEQSAGKLDSARTDLSATFSRVRWRGPDAAHAIQRFQQSQSVSLHDAAAMLRDCAKGLYRNADEQDKASAVDGGSTGGGHFHPLPKRVDHVPPGFAAKNPPLHAMPKLMDHLKKSSSDDVSVEHGPNGDKVTVSHKATAEGTQPLSKIPGLKGLAEGKGSAGISVTDTQSVETKHTDTSTTYKITSTLGVEGKAGFDLKHFGISGTLANGQKVEYSITVPKGTDPLSINPNDPGSWPPGTSVQVNAADTASASVGAKYAAIGVDGKVVGSEGTSQVVSKGADGRITAMTGPTEAVSNSAELSVGYKDVKAYFGANHDLTGTSFRSATFDPSTPEGKAALNQYLSGAGLPQHDGAGVSDSVTINKMDYSSGQKMGIKVPGFDFSVKGDDYTSNIVATTHGDGTTEQQWTVHNPGAPDMKATVSFDAHQNPIPGSTNYSYTIPHLSDIEAQMLNNKAFSGFDGSGYKAGDSVTISLTGDQMKAAQDMAKAAHENIIQSTGDTSVLGLSSSDASTGQFALAMQNAGASNQGLVDSLARVNQQAAGYTGQGGPQVKAFPGTLTKNH